MANYRAISTGVYSELARWEVWDGSAWVAAGVLPIITDTVYANGFTVTIDVDSFASSYNTTSISGVAAGGGFTLNAGITATGDCIAGTTTCLTHSGAAASSVVGSVLGGTGNPAHGAATSGDGTLHIMGNATGGSTSSLTDGVRRLSGNGGFIVYGDANAGTNNSSIGANGNGHQCIVLGRATGAAGSVRLGASDCEVNECASYNTNLVVTGKFILDSGNNIIGLTNCKSKNGAAVQVDIYDQGGNAITLNPLSAQGQASPADVRLNTAYANGALTGTAAIPPAASVALNVPVDATVGSYDPSIDVAALGNAVGQYITPQVLSAITS